MLRSGSWLVATDLCQHCEAIDTRLTTEREEHADVRVVRSAVPCAAPHADSHQISMSHLHYSVVVDRSRALLACVCVTRLFGYS